jgi:hypothetical protein
MALRLADEDEREHQAGDGEANPRQERLRTQLVSRGEVAGRDSGKRNGPIAGGFVQSHRQATSRRSHQVDLHNDGRGPAEPLVDAEQQVGEDDPAPARSADDEQRDGQPDEPAGDEPAGDEHRLAADTIAEAAREEIRQRLNAAKAHDEGEHRGRRAEAELAFAKQWHHAALKPHHRADKGVDEHEQQELPQVRPQPEHGIGWSLFSCAGY